MSSRVPEERGLATWGMQWGGVCVTAKCRPFIEHRGVGWPSRNWTPHRAQDEQKIGLQSQSGHKQSYLRPVSRGTKDLFTTQIISRSYKSTLCEIPDPNGARESTTVKAVKDQQDQPPGQGIGCHGCEDLCLRAGPVLSRTIFSGTTLTHT